MNDKELAIAQAIQLLNENVTHPNGRDFKLSPELLAVINSKEYQGAFIDLAAAFSIMLDNATGGAQLKEFEALEHIKANLPANQTSYEEGSGEGVFILVTPEVKAAYDNNETGGNYEGILDNDSMYYPELKHGARIPLEMRGNNRPVCPLNWLLDNYGAPDLDNI